MLASNDTTRSSLSVPPPPRSSALRPGASPRARPRALGIWAKNVPLDQEEGVEFRPGIGNDTIVYLVGERIDYRTMLFPNGVGANNSISTTSSAPKCSNWPKPGTAYTIKRGKKALWLSPSYMYVVTKSA